MSAPEPPRPDPLPVRHWYHGRCVRDPFAWLRPEAWQSVLRDPAQLPDAIRAHLDAENTHTDAVMADAAQLRETLASELRARMPASDTSVPEADGPYAYLRHYPEDARHPELRRHHLGFPAAGDTVLVDGNAEAEGHAFYRLGPAIHSPDHARLAYLVDTSGAESHTLRVRALPGGPAAEVAEGLAGDMAWAADSRTVFVTVLDDNFRAAAVDRVDTATGARERVLTEYDPAFHLGLRKLQRRAWIAVEARDHSDTTEIHLLDPARPDAPPEPLRRRERGVTHEVEDHDGKLVVRTNARGARDFQVLHGDPGGGDPLDLPVLVPHRPGVLITDITVRAEYLVRREIAEAQPRLVARCLRTGAETTLIPPEVDEAHAVMFKSGFGYATTTIRVLDSSPRRPTLTHDVDLATGTWLHRQTEAVPSGHDPQEYVVTRFTVPSHDGAEVPVTLTHHRAAPPAPERPLLLYAYGAYGMAVPASFSRDRLSLLRRGVTHAVAHVRGGTENGWGWYLDGKLAAKPNTFHDYLAVADGLIARGATGAGRILGNGRSAGGMVVGVAANWRPELFAALVGEVPFVDILNTMLDPTLPLTPPEWDEWGDPLHDPDAFDRMAAYSPYDNIRPRAYPAILATAGVADPRVTFWEPAKWIARVRANTTSAAPVCFSVATGAGHAGEAGRFGRVAETALVQAFMLRALGRSA